MKLSHKNGNKVIGLGKDRRGHLINWRSGKAKDVLHGDKWKEKRGPQSCSFQFNMFKDSVISVHIKQTIIEEICVEMKVCPCSCQGLCFLDILLLCLFSVVWDRRVRFCSSVFPCATISFSVLCLS